MIRSSEPFGQSRDAIRQRYALRTPAGFVPSCLPGWRDVRAIVQISPGMGAGFSQLQIELGKSGEGRGNTGEKEMVVYVVQGKCRASLAGAKHPLAAGGYAYVPAQTEYHFHQSSGARLLIFEKKYEPLAGWAKPGVLAGQASAVAGRPFMGDKDARLQVLLPEDPRFDMAVNIFTYQPGASLPLVESHVMEHGLLMLAGQGVYRLDCDWHPVQAGDVIWMGPYCPQWFVAMGPGPASYIYYKNVNRAP
jgi:(S)-ureidoglycine aminohydrolase